MLISFHIFWRRRLCGHRTVVVLSCSGEYLIKTFRRDVDNELRGNIIPFWLTRAVDNEHGGFIVDVGCPSGARTAANGTGQETGPLAYGYNRVRLRRLSWTIR